MISKRRMPRNRPARVAGAPKHGGALPVPDERGITLERRNQAGDVNVQFGKDAKGATRIYRMRDNPTDKALRHGIMTGQQHAAARKYRHHWHMCGLAGSYGSPGELDRIFATDPASYAQLSRPNPHYFHRKQYDEARQRLGDKTATLIESIVCFDKSIEETGFNLGWGSRPQAYAAAIERLKAGLDVLVNLWGI